MHKFYCKCFNERKECVNENLMFYQINKKWKHYINVILQFTINMDYKKKGLKPSIFTLNFKP